MYIYYSDVAMRLLYAPVKRDFYSVLAYYMFTQFTWHRASEVTQVLWHTSVTSDITL